MAELVVLTRTARFHTWSVISIYEAAVRCLSCSKAEEKAAQTLVYAHAYQDKVITEIFPHREHMKTIPCPKQPARPTSAYVDEKDLSSCTSTLTSEKRQRIKNIMKKSSIEYTIHGIANAESYAIDLFWDIIARFHADTQHLPREFFDDMVYIVEQESRHFTAWKTRLNEMGFQFGDFPFQAGLWQSAGDTADDILARLAVINLTHEAKGLDSYLKTKEKFLNLKDEKSCSIIDKNYQEEIGHVGFGVKWFKEICKYGGVEPISTFHSLSRQYFKGKLKEPFNRTARNAAGLTEDWYIPLT